MSDIPPSRFTVGNSPLMPRSMSTPNLCDHSDYEDAFSSEHSEHSTFYSSCESVHGDLSRRPPTPYVPRSQAESYFRPLEDDIATPRPASCMAEIASNPDVTSLESAERADSSLVNFPVPVWKKTGDGNTFRLDSQHHSPGCAACAVCVLAVAATIFLITLHCFGVL